MPELRRDCVQALYDDIDAMKQGLDALVLQKVCQMMRAAERQIV